MIDPEHKLPIARQAEELEISRSTIYYQARSIPEADLFLMRKRVFQAVLLSGSRFVTLSCGAV